MFLALAGALVMWNSVVFALYGIDKRRAIKGDWRISEKTLLLTALFFGGIGAILGGNLFHHKTQKWYFQLIWVLGIFSIFIGIYFLYWLYLKY
ncbi:DUF1294 domain-containing protein [Streptococcus hongkongensis]|nr:membrane protein [Streptococcus uberis]